MRAFIGLLAAALALWLAPATAQAAACIAPNGSYDIAGKVFRGQLVWPGYLGLDGPVAEKKITAEARFGSDCSVTWTAEGRTATGKWMQKGAAVVFDVDIFGFNGNVAADGTLAGSAIDDEGDMGRVTLKPTGGASAAVAPPRPVTAAKAGKCGVGDDAHPYLVGQTYYGRLSWQGDAPEALTLTFKADCTMGYVYDDGSVGSAEWGQVGPDVVLKVNGGYAVYNGQLSGQRFSGSLKNQNGKTGTFAFDRKQP